MRKGGAFMFNTTFEGGNLRISMTEAIKKEVQQYGINPIEICKLVESFANKILAAKTSGNVLLENEDTGAGLELDVRWESAQDVLVQVLAVKLDALHLPDKPNLPNGSKVDLGTRSPGKE